MTTPNPILVDIPPGAVLYTGALRAALGETLWRAIAPDLTRLCKGRVLGEDVLAALRRLRRTVDNPPERAESPAYDAANHTGREGGENIAEDGHHRPLRVRPPKAWR